MLIANHRQILEKRGQAVQLTFHHAFAMVEITVKVPVSETAAAGPYPENALREVYMRSMLTGYTVNYSETIDNDALRTVRGAAAEGVGDEGREDIRMYRVPIDEKEEFETGTITEYRSNIKNTFSEVSFPSRTFWRAARNFFTLRCTSTDSPRRRQRFIGSNRLIRTSHCCRRISLHSGWI